MTRREKKTTEGIRRGGTIPREQKTLEKKRETNEKPEIKSQLPSYKGYTRRKS